VGFSLQMHGFCLLLREPKTDLCAIAFLPSGFAVPEVPLILFLLNSFLSGVFFSTKWCFSRLSVILRGLTPSFSLDCFCLLRGHPYPAFYLNNPRDAMRISFCSCPVVFGRFECSFPPWPLFVAVHSLWMWVSLGCVS